MGIAGSLLLTLRRWLAETEEAVCGLRSEGLPRESRDLLRAFRVAFGPH